MTRPTGFREMKIGEKYPIAFEYRDPDLPAGVTIDAVVTAVSPASGLTKVGSPGINSDEVYQWVEAATVGTYVVRFTSTLSDGKKLIDDYQVRIVD